MATAHESHIKGAWLCATTARLCNLHQAGNTPYASSILYSEAFKIYVLVGENLANSCMVIHQSFLSLSTKLESVTTLTSLGILLRSQLKQQHCYIFGFSVLLYTFQ